MNYKERERVKTKGFKIYNDKTKSINERALALLNIITSHYWRARLCIENGRTPQTVLRKIMGKTYEKGTELDIHCYTKDWLGSNGDRYDKEIVKVLEQEYGYVSRKNRYLGDGCSVYEI